MRLSIEQVPRWLRQAGRPARPFLRAGRLWSAVDGARMSAAISFYGVLSLAPLVLLLVGVLGWWLDRALVEKGLVTQIDGLVGEQGGALIRHALESAKEPAEGLIASVAGFVVLVSGATGVFRELQAAFERLWRAGSGAPAAACRPAGNGGMACRCGCVASPTCSPSASCCWCRC